VRDRAASQGHVVVDLDHHAATAEQQHRVSCSGATSPAP
jgi:hypothetical protein